MPPVIQLPNTVAIGFTGHRALEDEARCRKAIFDFLEEQKKSASGLVYGISSVAAGGDLLFAESCIQLALPLRVLLPLPADEFRKDFDADTWSRAERVLARAASVEVIGRSPSREECYYECGIETVHQSRLLLALWNGLPAEGLGGTEDVVSFAKGVGRPVVWLHSRTGEVRRFNEKTEKDLLDDPELEFLNRLPDPVPNPHARAVIPADRKPGSSGVDGEAAGPRITDLRGDVKGITKTEINASTKPARYVSFWDADAPIEMGKPEALARAWFRKVDGSASRLAPQFRRLAAIPILFTAAAALFSGAASRGHGVGTWMTVGTALGILAAVLPAALRLNQRQILWVRTRTAAEVCRSVLAFWTTPAPYEAIGPEVIPELSGVLMSLNLLKMLDRGRREVALEEFKQRYRQERVSNQIAYFFDHAAQSSAEAFRFRAATWASVGFASLLNAWLFVSAHTIANLGPGPWKQWLALGASIGFQMATVAGALLAVNDCDRRKERYRELYLQLKKWDAQLEALRTWPSVLRVAGRIERALLAELIEWRSLIRNPKAVQK